MKAADTPRRGKRVSSAAERDEAITVRVNGSTRTVTVVPETPFLYVLRNQLGLKGTRFGCGTGLCGACTIIVDGRPITSCDLPTSAVSGRDVQTIEGIGREGELHALQRAFLEEGAGQCGYCLSGILMAAKALLDRHPAPTDAEIRAALEPNICRCGAHPRILRAVRRAAAETGP